MDELLAPAPLAPDQSRDTPVAKDPEPVLAANRRALRERVAAACRGAGRDPGEVRVVAVTKGVSPSLAAALVRAGEADLGENRLAELEPKRSALALQGLSPRWHFVGHLQRNKARRVVRLADEIHSVDSLALIAALQRLAVEEGRMPGLYLQVKLTAEAAKTGLPEAELGRALEAASGLPLLGLMTMAELSLEDDERGARAQALFTRLADLARALPAEAFAGGRPRLSMGMSSDFEAAIAAGADVVRIGSAFFEGLSAAAPSPGPGRLRRGV